MEQNVHTETKVCSKCKRELPTSEFYKDSNAKDGFYGYCKECSRDQERKNRMKRQTRMAGLPKNFLESASGGGYRQSAVGVLPEGTHGGTQTPRI